MACDLVDDAVTICNLDDSVATGGSGRGRGGRTVGADAFSTTFSIQTSRRLISLTRTRRRASLPGMLRIPWAGRMWAISLSKSQNIDIGLGISPGGGGLAVDEGCSGRHRAVTSSG